MWKDSFPEAPVRSQTGANSGPPVGGPPLVGSQAL